MARPLLLPGQPLLLPSLARVYVGTIFPRNMLGLTLLPVAVPKSAGITAICLAIASALTVAAKHYLIPKKYHVWVPNWNAIGLAFVTPQTFYPIAMAAGSLMNYFWAKRNPANFDMFMFPIAAGMLAGEGLGGVFQALLAVIGVDGGSKCFSWFDQNHAISDFSPLFSFRWFWNGYRLPWPRILRVELRTTCLVFVDHHSMIV